MEQEAAWRILLKGRDKGAPKKTNTLFSQSHVTNTLEMTVGLRFLLPYVFTEDLTSFENKYA